MRMNSILCILLFCLLLVCGGLSVALIRMRRQLSEWREYLADVKGMPERKIFVKGKGILVKINYELNDILEKNREQVQKLKRAEEANRKILTNLSHDVRTPLASLLGYLEALERQTVEEADKKAYLHVAYCKALDLRELVDTLFDWFKVSCGEQKYDMAIYDINELTREVIIGYLPLLSKQGITLTADIAEEENFVRIDRIAYTRIVNNLLRNALHHGKCSQIRVSVQKAEEKNPKKEEKQGNEVCSTESQVQHFVRIQIYNDGETIPKEQLPCIFERLYRGDASRTGGGNGLGLAIVKELTAAMQGGISLESSEEETVFSLSFPLVAEK